MSFRLTPTARQIAAALLPASVTFIALYWCRSSHGYWRCEATAPAGRVDGTGRTVWAAIAHVAQVLHEAGQVRAAEATADTPAARAAYRTAWAAAEGQPPAARFAAAEQAARAASTAPAPAAPTEDDEPNASELWDRYHDEYPDNDTDEGNDPDPEQEAIGEAYASQYD